MHSDFYNMPRLIAGCSEPLEVFFPPSFLKLTLKTAQPAPEFFPALYCLNSTASLINQCFFFIHFKPITSESTFSLQPNKLVRSILSLWFVCLVFVVLTISGIILAFFSFTNNKTQGIIFLDSLFCLVIIRNQGEYWEVSRSTERGKSHRWIAELITYMPLKFEPTWNLMRSHLEGSQ